MRIPAIRGIIDRRILVNYRIDPQVLSKILPEPFQPKVVNGRGIGGVCLIRLKHIRPRFLPSALGISSENAAHRIAVRWEQHGEVREGVYIPRRDTSSRFNTLVGGWLFPGIHHHAQFRVAEKADYLSVVLDSDDGQTHVAVEGFVATDLTKTSIFRSLQEASAFFERGSLGYSETSQPGVFDGLELRSFGWRVEPLQVQNVESSFFEDHRLFPKGSLEFDCALLMRGIVHEWHSQESLCCQSLRHRAPVTALSRQRACAHESVTS